jgi:hypothetical protein
LEFYDRLYSKNYSWVTHREAVVLSVREIRLLPSDKIALPVKVYHNREVICYSTVLLVLDEDDVMHCDFMH